MELKLKDTDVEQILLEWAAVKFPGMFNDVAFEGYSYNRAATLTKKEEYE